MAYDPLELVEIMLNHSTTLRADMERNGIRLPLLTGQELADILVYARRTVGQTRMPSPVFQRVLLFLKPEIGTSVHTVYRLSRLYDVLQERSALIMLAAWRGSTMVVTRARYRSALYDDERSRARSAATPARAASQPASNVAAPRTASS